MKTDKYIQQQELADFPGKRLPVCIVIDRSLSMTETDGTNQSRMDRVRFAIHAFFKDVVNNEKTSSSVEVCIITIGEDPTIVRQFSLCRTNNSLPDLVPMKEICDLGKGIQKALKLLEDRKKTYGKNNITYWQPWLVVMADGDTRNKQEYNIFDQVANEVVSLEGNNKLTVFPVLVLNKPNSKNLQSQGVGPRTYNKYWSHMASLSNVYDPITIDVENPTSFNQFFKFLNMSARSFVDNKPILDLQHSKKYIENNANNDIIRIDKKENTDLKRIEIKKPDLEQSKISYKKENKTVKKSKNKSLSYDDGISTERIQEKIKNNQAELSKLNQSIVTTPHIEEKVEKNNKEVDENKIIFSLNNNSIVPMMKLEEELIKYFLYMNKGDQLKISFNGRNYQFNSTDYGLYYVYALDKGIKINKQLFERSIKKDNDVINKEYEKVLSLKLDWDNC